MQQLKSKTKPNGKEVSQKTRTVPNVCFVQHSRVSWSWRALECGNYEYVRCKKMNARQKIKTKTMKKINVKWSPGQPWCHSATHVRSLFSLAIPALHNSFLHGQHVSQPSCESTFAAVPECNVLLPLGSLVEARAPRAKRTLLVAVIEWQQGIGTQTLLKRRDQKYFQPHLRH